MPNPFWPFFDLRIRTPRLELRIPRDDELIEVAAVAAAGVHAEDFMPFTVPWTERPSPELERSLFQWHWRCRGECRPERWRLTFAVYERGRAIGAQDVHADDFANVRTVATGSWLGREHQGRGNGKEMRAAVLHLAFTGLGALLAQSSAFADNAASIGVSRAVGYVLDGEELMARRGGASRHLRFRLERDEWERRRRDDIVLEGVEPCLPLLGAGPLD
ncbi:MAG: GNAT family N-acetyltransferase [Chloroflexi bacterium]|nr:MAG: GNAT family N-acetyltransferase [Chloroflexota bacterium]